MLAPERAVSTRSRVDPQSALVRWAEGIYRVVHAGPHAVVLRPEATTDDDLVVTTADLGLMPGGLYCSPPVFAHWRDYGLGCSVSLTSEARAVTGADRVDLHLGLVDIDVGAL